MFALIDEITRPVFSELDIDNQETISHSKRVLRACYKFATEDLGLEDGEQDMIDLLCGAKLHDVGKLFIDLSILNKPTPLTNAERITLSTHPGKGAELAVKHGMNRTVIETILYHHERWDGCGYPNRLAGHDIPLHARLVALVDTYDTIVSKRIYDPPRAVSVAVSEIEKNAGTQFDPQLARYFLEYLYRQHERVLKRAA